MGELCKFVNLFAIKPLQHFSFFFNVKRSFSADNITITAASMLIYLIAARLTDTSCILFPSSSVIFKGSSQPILTGYSILALTDNYRRWQEKDISDF